MKIQYNLLACGMLFIMGMASCEMKEELIPGNNNPEEKGLLQIGVAYNNSTTTPRTKADEDTEEKYVDADGFKVEISNSELKYNETFTYKTAEPLSVELPVATYTVYAHSDLVKAKKMTEPYYGQEQSIEIKAKQTVDVNMLCKMENTKFSLIYAPEFLTTFSSCEITITAGDCILNFSYDKSKNTDVQNPAPEYWMLEEGVTKITVAAVGWTAEGNMRIAQSFDYHKEDNSAYEGSDAITFTMRPTADNSGSTTIGVTVSLFEEVEGDTVEVPVEGEETGGDETDPEEPEEPENPDPGTGEITITDGGTGYLTNGVTVSGGEFPDDVNVIMDIPNGIQNMYVLVSTTNTVFEGMVAEIGLTSGEGMDLVNAEGTSGEGTSLSELFPLPEAGQSDYTFTMSEMLFNMLGNFDGTHDFKLKVVDKEGNEKSAVLTINIQK